jgi:hypothetical protein
MRFVLPKSKIPPLCFMHCIVCKLLGPPTIDDCVSLFDKSISSPNGRGVLLLQ